MRTGQQLLAALNAFCEDMAVEAMGSHEVDERLVLILGETTPVDFGDAVSVVDRDDLVMVVNNSGKSFSDQADRLVPNAAAARPEAVMLCGTASFVRRSGVSRVLAAQLVSPIHGMRVSCVAPVDQLPGEPIRAVEGFREARISPPPWVERIFGCESRP